MMMLMMIMMGMMVTKMMTATLFLMVLMTDSGGTAFGGTDYRITGSDPGSYDRRFIASSYQIQDHRIIGS